MPPTWNGRVGIWTEVSLVHLFARLFYICPDRQLWARLNYLTVKRNITEPKETLVITDLGKTVNKCQGRKGSLMRGLWSQQDQKWDCRKHSEGGCAGCRWFQQRETLLRSEHTETCIKEKAEWTRPGPADPVIQERDQETSRAKWLKPGGKNSPLGSSGRLDQLGCMVTCYYGKRFAFLSGYHREAMSIFCFVLLFCSFVFA